MKCFYFTLLLLSAALRTELVYSESWSPDQRELQFLEDFTAERFDKNTEYSLLVIPRDYNNDGLRDLAIADPHSCGNKTCNFVLYLQKANGGFTEGFDIGGLWWGYRIVPMNHGTSRFETCNLQGSPRQVFLVVLEISLTGIKSDKSRSRLIKEGENKNYCAWPPRSSFPCWKCRTSKNIKDCSWVKCGQRQH